MRRGWLLAWLALVEPAVAQAPPVGQLPSITPNFVGEIYATGVTANATIGQLPPNCTVFMITMQETAGHAVTGGVNVGTSSAAAQVVNGATVAASGLTTINAGTLLLQQLGGDTLFISAGSAWNSASVNIQVFYLLNL